MTRRTARPDGTLAGWTVFTGDNGSGKSTLLKSIAIGLTGRDTARALQPSFHRWIREGVAAEKATIELDVVACAADDFPAGQGNAPSDRFPVKLVIENGSSEPTLRPQAPTGKTSKDRTPERTIWNPDARGWFSCGYDPFRRVFGASPDAMRQMVAPSTGRFVTMFQEAASLAEVDQSLRQLNHKELENKAAERERARGGLNVAGEWQRARKTARLRSVLATLHSMMGERERCMYCHDSHGTDIDHFWPKASYPERMFRWSDFLLCCPECARFKGDRFPLDDGIPLLVDPTAEDPWLHLEFDPATGNITARIDPQSGEWSPRGTHTVEVLRLDRRGLMASGYRHRLLSN